MEAVLKSFTESNFWNFMGLEVEQFERGQVTLKLPMRYEFENVQGMPHGGVLASILDTSMGITIASLGYENSTTLDMNIHFLKALQAGDIHCKGSVIHQGNSTFFAESLAYDDNGAVLAHANGVFRAKKISK